MTLPLDMPAHLHHAPSFAAVQAELAREAAARARTYPGQIAKGRMTQQQAEWQQGVIAAIQQDLAAVIAVAVPQHTARPEPVEGPSFTWTDKRGALLRELDQRARFYPGWIDKGRLTQADADRQTAALTAMLALYDDGLTWQPAPGSTTEQVRQQWRAISAELAPTTPQKELAL